MRTLGHREENNTHWGRWGLEGRRGEERGRTAGGRLKAMLGVPTVLQLQCNCPVISCQEKEGASALGL